MEADTVFDQHADKDARVPPGFFRAHPNFELVDTCCFLRRMEITSMGVHPAKLRAVSSMGRKPLPAPPTSRLVPSGRLKPVPDLPVKIMFPFPVTLAWTTTCPLVKSETKSWNPSRKKGPASLRRSGLRSRAPRIHARNPATIRLCF